MRINIYAQEITTETEIVEKVAKNETGAEEIFTGIRWFLLSPETLHHTPEDDDRSAITVWLPSNPDRRKNLALTFREMADYVESTITAKTM